MKKSLSFFLLIGIVLSSILVFIPPMQVSAATTLSESEFATKIESLKSRYPDGQYWNQYNGTETIDGKSVAKAGPNPCNGTRTDSDHNGQKCTSVGFCYYCTCK